MRGSCTVFPLGLQFVQLFGKQFVAPFGLAQVPSDDGQQGQQQGASLHVRTGLFQLSFFFVQAEGRGQFLGLLPPFVVVDAVRAQQFVRDALRL